MRISISGKNLEISSYMREVAEKKLAKLDRYFPQDTEAQVTLSVERSRHIVEVTIPHGGRLIRAEEVSTDMYASLDNVLDKLEKQIVHNRTRLEKGLRQGAFVDLPIEEEEEESGPRIVRYKSFPFKPMSEEEAMNVASLFSRDNARTPMQWSDGRNAGFSDALLAQGALLPTHTG